MKMSAIACKVRDRALGIKKRSLHIKTLLGLKLDEAICMFRGTVSEKKTRQLDRWDGVSEHTGFKLLLDAARCVVSYTA